MFHSGMIEESLALIININWQV
ncbi:hypothetical protein EMIT0158MI4_140113 [Burkholderia ambifaria]